MAVIPTTAQTKRLIGRPNRLGGLMIGLLLAVHLPSSVLADSEARRAVSGAPRLLVPIVSIEPVDGFALEQVFIGRIEARRRSDLGFERAGLLTEVLVREGEQVAAGAVLARLDRSLLQAQRAELLASVESAQADLALAEATANRYRRSVNEGAVTRQNLDEARESARAGAANLRLAQARVATVDLHLDKALLRAPFDGVVIRRDADEGAVLGAGQPVLTLQERALPEIRIGVAGPMIDQLRVGKRYPLTINGAGIKGRLRAILPLRNHSQTVDALFEPIIDDGPAQNERSMSSFTTPNSSATSAARATTNATGAATATATTSDLRAGNLAELRLSKRVEAKGFWLPLTALSEGSRGLWRVLVAEQPVTPGGDSWTLSSRTLQVLHLDGARVYVQGALNAGELVVADGLHRVVPGQEVRISDGSND